MLQCICNGRNAQVWLFLRSYIHSFFISSLNTNFPLIFYIHLSSTPADKLIMLQSSKNIQISNIRSYTRTPCQIITKYTLSCIGDQKIVKLVSWIWHVLFLFFQIFNSEKLYTQSPDWVDTLSEVILYQFTMDLTIKIQKASELDLGNPWEKVPSFIIANLGIADTEALILSWFRAYLSSVLYLLYYE